MVVVGGWEFAGTTAEGDAQRAAGEAAAFGTATATATTAAGGDGAGLPGCHRAAFRGALMRNCNRAFLCAE